MIPASEPRTREEMIARAKDARSRLGRPPVEQKPVRLKPLKTCAKAYAAAMREASEAEAMAIRASRTRATLEAAEEFRHRQHQILLMQLAATGTDPVPERPIPTRYVRSADLAKFVVKVTGIDFETIASPQRHAEISTVRQVLAWAMVELGGKSMMQTGRHLGGRDHTTILHAKRKVDKARREAGIEIDRNNWPDTVLAVLRSFCPVMAGR